MKKLTLALLLFVTASQLFAQQDAQFSQYMFNQLFVNPASAGADSRYINMNLIHRRQWVGYSPTFDDGGAPTSTVVSFAAPINILNSGIGLHIVNDAIGPLINNEIKLSYAYHISTKSGGRVSIGVQGGFYNQAIDFGRLRPNEPGDPLIEGRGRENQFIPDFGAGIYYTKGYTFAGLSASHILEPSINYGTIIEINSLERNYTLIGGTRFDITTDIAVSPSAIVKSNFRNTLSYEGTALVSYQDKYYGGVSFRDIGPSNDLIFLIGASFLKDNSLSLGYAFDYVLTGVAAKAATSHEIRVGYKIPAPARAQRYIIRTPRFRFE